MSTPARRPSLGTYVGTAWALIGLGLADLILLPLVITAIALIIIWVGIPMLAGLLSLVRATSMGFRRLSGRVLGGPVTPPYRPVQDAGWTERLRIRLSDPTTYRDLIWLPIAAVIALPLGLVALVFYVVFPLGYVASPVMLRTFFSLGGAVLRQADSETAAAALTARIGALAQSRADAVDTQAAELRRIERDLHDGAQAKLVALSLNLGLAEQLVHQDPQASRDLIAESRKAAGVALADLRDLVRGILPPVLADRGLVGAVQALALNHPVDTEVDVQLAGRPPAPVESAMYFAVAEALTNSAKHSAAQRAWVWGRYDDGHLRVNVGDNGVGGAGVTPGGGLAGLERRLAAFDGTVSVASPLGGGTIVSLELPCELSWPKT